ncbi:MAG: aspartate carbamoyltransferase [Clostridia bacterium]|nr:aspartate carbamoyltransferase [Clostridia bacterium]
MRHLIDIQDLSLTEIDDLILTAESIMADPAAYARKCEGKKLATLFYEPSTRTRLSFEAAMYELGGHVLGFADAKSSSVSKGESLQDTAKIVSFYADLMAIRHPRDGAALAAAMKSDVPVINAGDGEHDHPTQTLTDLLTIHREMGHLGNLTVGVCGDLKYGRTVHSLLAALSRYPDMNFVLIAPEELQVPGYVLEMMEKRNQPFRMEADLEKALPDLDILYMTRIQRERFPDEATYERLKDSYNLTRPMMDLCREHMAVMHPLPRVTEIDPQVDDDPRAAYFRQACNGKYIRMALILKLLEQKSFPFQLLPPDCVPLAGRHCPNPRCITRSESNLALYVSSSQNGSRCIFCDTKI